VPNVTSPEGGRVPEEPELALTAATHLVGAPTATEAGEQLSTTRLPAVCSVVVVSEAAVALVEETADEGEL